METSRTGSSLGPTDEPGIDGAILPRMGVDARGAPIVGMVNGGGCRSRRRWRRRSPQGAGLDKMVCPASEPSHTC